jgi:hypothetical protein
MTLTNIPPGSPTEASTGAALDVLWSLFCGLVNRGVAQAIARRERQAERVARHYPGGRPRSEIGVYRYRIADGMAWTVNALTLAPVIVDEAVDEAQIDDGTASRVPEACL